MGGDPGGAQRGDPARAHGAGVVARVVEDLDLEAVRRPVERGDRVEQPPGDRGLVVQRQLHGDHRQLVGERRRRRLGATPAPRGPGQGEAVRAVDRQHDQRDHVHRVGPGAQRAHQLSSGQGILGLSEQ
jgi:hypothetical protein